MLLKIWLLKNLFLKKISFRSDLDSDFTEFVSLYFVKYAYFEQEERG